MKLRQNYTFEFSFTLFNREPYLMADSVIVLARHSYMIFKILVEIVNDLGFDLMLGSPRLVLDINWGHTGLSSV